MGNSEMYKFSQEHENMMPNSFWKIMMKFHLMWDVAVTIMVKSDVNKQHWSLFIKYYVLDYLLLGVAFAALEFKNLLIQSIFGAICHSIWWYLCLSIMMKFSCLLKRWLLSWKCLDTNLSLGLSISFWWLFNLILKLVFDFPTNCFLHKVHSIR